MAMAASLTSVESSGDGEGKGVEPPFDDEVLGLPSSASDVPSAVSSHMSFSSSSSAVARVFGKGAPAGPVRPPIRLLTDISWRGRLALFAYELNRFDVYKSDELPDYSDLSEHQLWPEVVRLITGGQKKHDEVWTTDELKGTIQVVNSMANDHLKNELAYRYKSVKTLADWLGPAATAKNKAKDAATAAKKERDFARYLVECLLAFRVPANREFPKDGIRVVFPGDGDASRDSITPRGDDWFINGRKIVDGFVDNSDKTNYRLVGVDRNPGMSTGELVIVDRENRVVHGGDAVAMDILGRIMESMPAIPITSTGGEDMIRVVMSRSDVGPVRFLIGEAAPLEKDGDAGATKWSTGRSTCVFSGDTVWTLHGKTPRWWDLLVDLDPLLPRTEVDVTSRGLFLHDWRAIVASEEHEAIYKGCCPVWSEDAESTDMDGKSEYAVGTFVDPSYLRLVHNIAALQDLKPGLVLAPKLLLVLPMWPGCIQGEKATPWDTGVVRAFASMGIRLKAPIKPTTYDNRAIGAAAVEEDGFESFLQANAEMFESTKSSALGEMLVVVAGSSDIRILGYNGLMHMHVLYAKTPRDLERDDNIQFLQSILARALQRSGFLRKRAAFPPAREVNDYPRFPMPMIVG